MHPAVNADTIFTDAKGRRFRIKVEYLDKIVDAPRKSLPLVQSVAPLVPLTPFRPLPPDAFVKPLGVAAAPPPLPPAPPPTLLIEPSGAVPKIAPPVPVKTVYDHNRIGGRFTVFSLLYGDFFDMHKRHLNAIMATCPPEVVEIRIGSNQLGQKSMDLVQGLNRDGRIRLHYCHADNARKYPVMREMLWDPTKPIETKWMIWFDDDSMCDKNHDWLPLLSQQIVNYPDVDMLGPARFYRLTETQPAWLRSAPWYKGRMFRDKTGKGVPNGDKVHFCVGAFWALRVEAMRAADIPCKRLGHNGGDWTVGEQLYQAGFKMKNWCGDKNIVEWSAVSRRGLTEVHPGTKNRAH